MTNIGRGVTKEGPTYHIYIYISFAQFVLVYVGLAQARPNYCDVSKRFWINVHEYILCIYFITEKFMSVEVSPRPVKESSAGVMVEFGVFINDTVRLILLLVYYGP